ncbi:Undecaprenyl diphosphate synthase [Myriangium duriaei CBS 260.36]|uniref:ditrans,polycis-polyprenyl diphosphate synthase [(2E,6E)-farnesyldiphosphate specific] n=1 Tax=Myriangium duriaei CBS 260.36 TaxID=1168546 RepID=A0A9P4MM79_9PEZI|nr:Undecaprenyl diphosphate synthase [Myriangium duriaei CBS 260.36]
MVGLRQAALLRDDVDEHGNRLSAEQREALLKPFLPETKEEIQAGRRVDRNTKSKPRQKPVRSFIKTTLHVLIFNLMQTVFAIFYKIRKAYRKIISVILGVMYHHHRTPELIQKDVRGFSKLPQHLSVSLSLEGRMDEAALETLINNVCECVAWTACTGIPMLSIYERTGVLKSSLPHLHRQISSTLSSYYGSDNVAKPTVSLRAPQIPAFSPPSASPDPSDASPPHLSVLLLSESDGRRTLVDLTKTLAEMSQKHKLAPEDISTELIDAELSESVMGEPDLLILFGSSVVLDGYPPWQVRLSEIFHVPDNHEVSYQVFLRGLQKFAGAQMRFGS